MEGGVLGRGVSSHPVEIGVIDYDTDGCSPEDLVQIPQPNGVPETAYARQWVAEVNPARCELLQAAVSAEREPAVFLGFSADGYWSNDLGWVESAQDASQFDDTQAPTLMQLIGSGVCVLKVDPLHLGALPTIENIEGRIEAFLCGQASAPTKDDKAAFLLDLKGEFALLNEDPSAFAPAVLAILAREQSDRQRSIPRPS